MLTNLRTAAQAYIDLLDRIRSSPPPPHTDYWHQSMDEAESALRAALGELQDAKLAVEISVTADGHSTVTLDLTEEELIGVRKVAEACETIRVAEGNIYLPEIGIRAPNRVAEPPAEPEESLRGIIEQIVAEGGADQNSHAYLGEAMLARIRSALNRRAEPPADPPRAEQWSPDEIARMRMEQSINMCQGCFRPMHACVCSQMNRRAE